MEQKKLETDEDKIEALREEIDDLRREEERLRKLRQEKESQLRSMVFKGLLEEAS